MHKLLGLPWFGCFLLLTACVTEPLVVPGGEAGADRGLDDASIVSDSDASVEIGPVDQTEEPAITTPGENAGSLRDDASTPGDDAGSAREDASAPPDDAGSARDDAGAAPDSGLITPPAPVRDAGPWAPPGSFMLNASAVEQIDSYVLSRNIEQLASLELRREGRVVWTKSRAQIQEFVPSPGTFYMTELSFKKRWLDTFWAWTYQQSQTANADAVRIASALSRYFIGARAVSIGPHCVWGDIGYQRGTVEAGMPGDGVRDKMNAEYARSEDAIIGFDVLADHDPALGCITSIEPVGALEQVAVTIDLSLDGTVDVDDRHITAGSSDAPVRAGVPVVPAFTGRQAIGNWRASVISDRAQTLDSIDDYVLRMSVQQIKQLEVRRGGSVLFTRSFQDITPLLATCNTQLTALQCKRAWVDVFRDWLGGSQSLSDPVRVV